MTELFGDPLRLAPQQFRTAQELCGDCREYHALWPYRRLSRMVAGIEATADLVQELLRALTPADGRILITGSADAGMFALTALATKHLNPSIDVVDRCPTPLATCRAYAGMHALSITPLELDIRSSTPTRLYDVVYGDCILQFMPRPLRVDVLRRLRQTLSERAHVIFVERLWTGREETSRRRDHALETLDALAARGIALPEDEASFRLKLERTANARRERLASDSDRLGSVLAEAGYVMKALEKDKQPRTTVLPNGETVTMEVAVASA